MSLCKGFTQGGSNADVVLADSFLKNITDDVDWATGYEAVVSDAEGNHLLSYFVNNIDPVPQTSLSIGQLKAEAASQAGKVSVIYLLTILTPTEEAHSRVPSRALSSMHTMISASQRWPRD
jgi:hypothetical protein